MHNLLKDIKKIDKKIASQYTASDNERTANIPLRDKSRPGHRIVLSKIYRKIANFLFSHD